MRQFLAWLNGAPAMDPVFDTRPIGEKGLVRRTVQQSEDDVTRGSTPFDDLTELAERDQLLQALLERLSRDLCAIG